MRNPLSAIIQCADEIGTSLAEYDNDLLDVILPREVVDNHAEAAQTIMICAQHQKRIIEDVLTLSKLDSNLLLITPIEVQPVSVIGSSLRMFDGDSQKNDIELSFVTESSYLDLGVDWVQLDPSRMLQVLINLVTNAIKFTQSEAERRITIKLGASLEPHNTRNGVEYLPRKADRNDMSVGSAWGSGESIYLYVEVHDSGRGLTEDERTLLFQRFTQASPRTHVQYGGSGLGLFISRELTELQGGRIGVSSKAGIGSTFAFCVRARRCTAPEQPETADHHMSTPSTRLSPRQLSRLAGGNSPSRSPDRLSNLSILGPIHVLVVEDNIVNQKVLAKQLGSAGCTVHVANHGTEALTFLATTRFWSGIGETGVELSLVLMDLEMPVMDGLTCVKEIRKLQEEGKITGHVPVIAVTANARSEQIIIAKEAGMDSVVTKPFRIPELMPVMERLLSKAAHQGSERPAEPERSFSAPH
jgi:CheY-like chemotaxis protein